MDSDLGHFIPDGNQDYMNKFDIFKTPRLNQICEKSFESVYYPQIPITPTTKEIQIKVEPQPHFIDLSNTYITFDITILSSNLRKLAPISPTFKGVAFDQSIGSTIFRDIDIKINNQSICGLRNTYYWVAYLQQILCFQEDARKSRLEEVGFYEDANPATTNFVTPSGSRTRALLTDESKKLSIKVPIYHGFFQISKALIPMTPLNFTFLLNDTLKVLKSELTDRTFIYSISDFKLFITKIKTIDQFQLNIERQLSKQPATYCFDHLKCTEFSLPQGLKQQHFPDIFNSIIQPQLAIFWFVDHSEAQGSINTSIFNAKPFDLQEIYCRLENEIYPSVPFDLDFTDTDYTNKYLRAYSQLLPGNMLEDSGILIDEKKFAQNGFFFLLINFTPDQNGLFLQHIGNTFLHLTFKNQLPEAIKMYVFTKNPVCLKIDSNRQVERDYVL